jgi:uncharacterized membrane protein
MGLLGIFGKSWVLTLLAIAIIANLMFKQNPIIIMVFFVLGITVGYYAREEGK